MSIVLSLLFFNVPLAKLADALDLKSGTYYSVWVQIPQGILGNNKYYFLFCTMEVIG